MQVTVAKSKRGQDSTWMGQEFEEDQGTKSLFVEFATELFRDNDKPMPDASVYAFH